MGSGSSRSTQSSSCMTVRDKRTILGVEPTTRGLAFAAFDRGKLLDWGRVNRSNKRDDLALLDYLLGHYGVDVLVVEDPDAQSCRRGERAKRLLRDLNLHAEMRRIKTKAVG